MPCLHHSLLDTQDRRVFLPSKASSREQEAQQETVGTVHPLEDGSWAATAHAKAHLCYALPEFLSTFQREVAMGKA